MKARSSLADRLARYQWGQFMARIRSKTFQENAIFKCILPQPKQLDEYPLCWIKQLTKEKLPQSSHWPGMSFAVSDSNRIKQQKFNRFHIVDQTALNAQRFDCFIWLREKREVINARAKLSHWKVGSSIGQSSFIAMRVHNLIYIRWMASMSRLDHDIGSHMATCHRLDRYLTINRRRRRSRRHAIRRIIYARPQIACRPTLALCNSWQVFVLRPFRFCVAASQQSRWIYRLLLAAHSTK